MSTAQTDRLTLRFSLADTDATEALARALARTAPVAAAAALAVVPTVVFLHGDLGAGKSTLARAWLRALGVRGAIRSPTYTLVERYPLNETAHAIDASGASFSSESREALHLDLYRIGGGGELEFLGLDDVPAVLWLVEWPERGEGGLPDADLQVRLSLPSDESEGRIGVLEAGTEAGRAWLQRLAEAAGNHGLRPFAEA